MPGALVGTIGAVSVGAASAAVTAAFGTGESRTASNLLVCFVVGGHGTAVPATPAGWSSAVSLFGNSIAAAIFYMVAAGGDAAPTIAGQASMIWSVQLAEFSGLDSVSPLDKTGSTPATATPLTLTNSGPDAAIGGLVVYAAEAGLSTATNTMTSSGNNWTPIDNDNDATSTADHYLFGYGFTTANSLADKNTMAFIDTADNATGVIASFKLPAGVVPFVPRRMPLGV